MPAAGWDTKQIQAAPEAIAPDGSAVRILGATAHGSMIHFMLPAGAISKPVAHRTVEEIWYVLSGHGRIWRRSADREAVTEIGGGISLTIPTGTAFQFRNDGADPLEIIGVTMPPWPDEDEAYSVEGKWPASV